MTRPATDAQLHEPAMPPAFTQAAWPVRFVWGMTDAAYALTAAPPGSVAVVVDVLSFTTTVCAAAEVGAVVIPFGWDDGRAAEVARQRGAILAVGRHEAAARGTNTISLSPITMKRLTRSARVLLPSPNGSTISSTLASHDVHVVAACLRNAGAVASYLARTDPQLTVVIAAGERWPDGSLRPCLEDLWGAGAVLHHLAEALGPLGYERLSPEARFAADAFSAARRRIAQDLPLIVSGQELVAGGFGEDVAYAAEQDTSSVVPLLCDGMYHAAAT